MFMYVKKGVQLALLQEELGYKLIHSTDSHVNVERGSKEEMECLFRKCVTQLRSV